MPPQLGHDSVMNYLGPIMAFDAMPRDESSAVTALQHFVIQNVTDAAKREEGHRLIEQLLLDIRRDHLDTARREELERLAKIGKQVEERQRAATEQGTKQMTTTLDQAMDQVRSDLRAAWQAREDVRPVIGNVSMAMDAAETYKLALDHLKVDVPADLPRSAYGALFKASLRARRQSGGGSSSMALDTAPAAPSQQVSDLFPGIGNIRHA